MRRSGLILVLAGVSMVCLVVSAAHAATVGYWRFESEANFLEDSGPNGLDLTANGSPLPVYSPLPALGYGASFPDSVPLTGEANNGIASFPSNGGILIHADNPAFEFTDVTIEAMVSRVVTYTDNHLISQYSTTGNQRGWAFGLRRSSLGGAPFLYYCEDGAAAQYVQPNVDSWVEYNDYYVAVTFDSSGTATFYKKNLTQDLDMEVVTVTHEFGSLFNSTADFVIGNNADGTRPFAGAIDEVRISDCVLEPEDLLIPLTSTPGDANRDGFVDAADAAVLAENWLSDDGVNWAKGDFNNDDVVDDIDATLLAVNWTGTTPWASVPEPAALWSLIVLLAGFVAYFRTVRE